MKKTTCVSIALLLGSSCGKCPPEDSLMAQKSFDEEWVRFVKRELPAAHHAEMSGIMPKQED